MRRGARLRHHCGSTHSREETSIAHDEEIRADAAQLGVLNALSNEMVRLYKDQFGRGPTRARTQWAGDDILITVLEGTFTPAERNLARMHEHQRLRDTRMFFQYATVSEFCEPVQRLTGRKVRAFISGIDTKVDGVSIETFLLHPVGHQGPSRIDLDAEDGGRGRESCERQAASPQCPEQDSNLRPTP